MSNFDKLYEAVMSEDDVELGVGGDATGAADIAPAPTYRDWEKIGRAHV